MCRWMAYKGNPVRLSTILTYPENSIVHQAKDAKYHPGCQYSSKLIAEKRNCRVNADGFGVAWYSTDVKDEQSCVFRSTQPSWGDMNLIELGRVIKSPTVFAHVRAMTSPGLDPIVGSVSIQNCHPFKWKTFTFMHNGGIQHFARIKRKLQSKLCDEFYSIIAGSTDSENIFALFLSILKRNVATAAAAAKEEKNKKEEEEEEANAGGCSSKSSNDDDYSHQSSEKKSSKKKKKKKSKKKEEGNMLNATPKQIAKALQDTIQTIVDMMIGFSSRSSACSLNLAVTNGSTIIATRFRRGKSEPPSLYFAMLKEIKGENGKTKIWAQNEDLVHPKVKELHAECVIVSSEPLTMDPCWNLVAESTMIIIHGDKKNRSTAGKVELIPMTIHYCKRSSSSSQQQHTTCCPLISKPRSKVVCTVKKVALSASNLKQGGLDNQKEQEEEAKKEAKRKKGGGEEETTTMALSSLGEHDEHHSNNVASGLDNVNKKNGTNHLGEGKKEQQSDVLLLSQIQESLSVASSPSFSPRSRADSINGELGGGEMPPLMLAPYMSPGPTRRMEMKTGAAATMKRSTTRTVIISHGNSTRSGNSKKKQKKKTPTTTTTTTTTTTPSRLDMLKEANMKKSRGVTTCTKSLSNYLTSSPSSSSSSASPGTSLLSSTKWEKEKKIITIWQRYVEPSLLIGMVCALFQKRRFLKTIRKYPRCVSVGFIIVFTRGILLQLKKKKKGVLKSSALSSFFAPFIRGNNPYFIKEEEEEEDDEKGARVRSSTGDCDDAKRIGDEEEEDDDHDSTIICRRRKEQLRSDLMWLILLMASLSRD